MCRKQRNREKAYKETTLPVGQVFATIFNCTQPEGMENQLSVLSLAKDLCSALACIAMDPSHLREVHTSSVICMCIKYAFMKERRFGSL